MCFCKVKIKYLLLLLVIFPIWSCIDPYNVDVSNSENLLVVEALITDEIKSHEVKLSRSISNIGEIPNPEENATVMIFCDDGNEEVLQEKAPGVYKTDSIKFKAVVGKSYKLKIKTENGDVFESSKCKMLEPSKIDRLYYKKGTTIDVNNEEVEGIQFYVDGESAIDSYVRWLYEEDWKFSITHPQYIDFDEHEDLIYIPVENFYCWKNSISNEIVVQSLENQNSTSIDGKKVCFIPSGINDKFNIKYSILIKQLTISKEEYNYWNKLKESTEDVGDIFGSQPYSTEGNIKNITNSEEIVLGYFQTGAVTSKRIFITWEDAAEIGLKDVIVIPYCHQDTVDVDNNYFHNLYDIYEYYVLNGNFKLHDKPMERDALIIVEPTCVDCSLTGSLKKPKFWED